MGSTSSGVSERGQATGIAYTPDGSQHGFLLSNGVTTDLGTLGGANSFGDAINSLGQVAGTAQDANGVSRAFLLSQGAMNGFGEDSSSAELLSEDGTVAGSHNTVFDNYYFRNAFGYKGVAVTDLGTLGGARSFVTAINRRGQIIGQGDVTNGYYYSTNVQHAFLWSGGAPRDLSLGGDYSLARAINGAGQVVGYSSTPEGRDHAFLFDGAAMIDIGALINGASTYGTTSEAVGINEGGEAIGVFPVNSYPCHSFLHSKGALRELGTLGGSAASARDINASGQVVGSSSLRRDTSSHAFLYSGGALKDLGTLGGANSSATDISDAGQVVGSADTKAGASHAFLYSNGFMADLNALIPPGSGWVLTSASSIKRSGHIVGEGTLNGQARFFILTPASASSGATVAADDSASTPRNTPIDIAVLANDSSADGQPLAIGPVSTPANGAVSDNGNGTLRYTPRARWAGTDAFTYSAVDSAGAASTATVTITVLHH